MPAGAAPRAATTWWRWPPSQLALVVDRGRGHPVLVAGGHGRGDLMVKGPPLLVEQARVGYLAGQRVLEAVLEVGGNAGRAEMLAGLKVRESPLEVGVRGGRDRSQNGERHAGADRRR